MGHERRLHRMKTPYYILNENELDASLNGFKSAIRSKCENSIPSYSVKTNSLPYIIKRAGQMGYFAEVVSDDEYELALYCGFSKDRIVFNGPFKSKDVFIDSIRNGSIVNIETFRELEWLSQLPDDKVFEVGLRMNINISSISPDDENHIDDNSRFGFSCESGDFDKAISILQSLPNVHLNCIHIHRTSRTRSISFYSNLIDYALGELNKRGIKVRLIDIGGGYFGQMPGKPTYMEYASVISDRIRAHHFESSTVIIEPGNAIVASCLSFVTSVIDVKRHDDRFFITIDGSRIDVDPFFRKRDFFKSFIYESEEGSIAPMQIIGGCTCLENDRLMELQNHRLLSIGDQIHFHRVGAYTMTLTPLFIRYWPEVYVKNDDGIKLVREKFDVKKLIK